MSFALFLTYVFLSYFRPIELFSPALGEYRPMMILWGIAFVLACGRAVSRREMAGRGLHLWLLTGLCTMVALSQIFAGWAGGATQALSDFSPSVMLFVLVLLNVTSVPRLKATIAVLAFSMLCAAGMSIHAYRSGAYASQLVLRQNSPAMDEAEDQGRDMTAAQAAEMIPALDTSGWFLWRIRGMGFLNDPNDFAQTLVAVLPLLWVGWSRGRWLFNALRVLLPAAVIGYAVMLTQSRGALVGLGAMGMVAIARRLGTTRTLILGGVLGAVVIAGSVVGGRGFSSKERSAEERIEAWQVGLQLLQWRPLSGAGFGNFTDHNPLTAHNSFVLGFSELGLIGYFFWIALIVLAYKGLSRPLEALSRLEPAGEAHRIATLMRASLVGFLACAWFLSRTYAPSLFFMLGLCVAGGWVARQAIPDAAVRDELAVIPWRRDAAVFLAATIAAVYGFVLMHRLSGG